MPVELRKDYEKELEDLTQSFIRMGAQTIAAVDKTFAALNTVNRELAAEVVAGDGAIDEMEKGIEARCFSILLRQQPVAGDLRHVTAVLKMISDIERIADAARDISSISIGMPPELPPRLYDIRKMASAAREMVADSIKSFTGESLVLADYVIRRDEIVNGYFHSVKEELAVYVAAHPNEGDMVIEYAMILKYIERIGDHAVNIAEWVKFIKTGVHKNTKVF